VGNGLAGADLGGARLPKAPVRRSNRVGCAGKARAKGAGIVARAVPRRDVAEDNSSPAGSCRGGQISHAVEQNKLFARREYFVVSGRA